MLLLLQAIVWRDEVNLGVPLSEKNAASPLRLNSFEAGFDHDPNKQVSFSMITN